MGLQQTTVFATRGVERLPGAAPPADFPRQLCRVAARVRYAGYQHEVMTLKVAAKVLYSVAQSNGLTALAWHANQIHDLDLSDSDALVRLYDLLDGLEKALESALDKIRAH